MADQKAQDSNPLAEKSLLGSDSSDTSDAEVEFDAEKLEVLKKKAFYSLLLAFALETSPMSNKRASIIEKLMNEWEISQETRIAMVDHIQKNLQAQEQPQRVAPTASRDTEVKTVEEKPVTESNPTCVGKYGSKWGNVNPESLVGKWVRVKMPDEANFEEFIIKEYDSNQEIHRLETADPNAMEMDDELSWVDIRRIPSSHIMWQGGRRPDFDAVPNQGAHF